MSELLENGTHNEERTNEERNECNRLMYGVNNMKVVITNDLLQYRKSHPFPTLVSRLYDLSTLIHNKAWFTIKLVSKRQMSQTLAMSAL